MSTIPLFDDSDTSVLLQLWLLVELTPELRISIRNFTHIFHHSQDIPLPFSSSFIHFYNLSH